MLLKELAVEESEILLVLIDIVLLVVKSPPPVRYPLVDILIFLEAQDDSSPN